LKHNDMHRLNCLLTALLGAALLSTAAFAEADNLESLAAAPQTFIGKEVEVAGYCVKGGVKGDVLGYECTTEGTVYVDAGAVEPEAAKEKLNGTCKDQPKEAACRATIRFVPHSVSTSNVLEPGKTITIFNTKKAELSF
jgi:hypothetical protein